MAKALDKRPLSPPPPPTPDKKPCMAAKKRAERNGSIRRVNIAAAFHHWR